MSEDTCSGNLDILESAAFSNVFFVTRVCFHGSPTKKTENQWVEKTRSCEFCCQLSADTRAPFNFFNVRLVVRPNRGRCLLLICKFGVLSAVPLSRNVSASITKHSSHPLDLPREPFPRRRCEDCELGWLHVRCLQRAKESIAAWCPGTLSNHEKIGAGRFCFD